MEIILLAPILLGFLICILLMPAWIKRAKAEGLVGKDIHKTDKREVAESGGLIVAASFVIGVLVYAAIETFYFKSRENLLEIFGLLLVICLMAIIGMVDDIIGWKKGLSRKSRILFVLVASLPLMVISVGVSQIGLPIIGNVDVGILYALLFIPIGVVGAATTFNFMEGYNGLGAGQGVLILSAFSVIALLLGHGWLSVIGLCMVTALAGFWLFNRYPAKVFPGDVMTYPIGAMIAGMAILGNFERIAVFIFIPYIIEVILKLRGGLVKESFAEVQKDGSLELREGKIYGLEHAALWLVKKIKGKAYEWDVVYSIYAFQLIIIGLSFIIFKNHLLG